MKIAAIVLALATFGSLIGCAGRPSILPNSDPNLRHTAAEFAADAAKRHPYKSDAPRGGDALANAEFDTTVHHIVLLNFGDEDWHDVEVWVNQKYVVFLPLIDKNKVRAKTIEFEMLYDDSGNWFTTNGGKTPITTIEIYRGGKMYNVPFKVAD